MLTHATVLEPSAARQPLLEQTEGRGAQGAIDAAGSPDAAQICLDLVSKAGRIVAWEQSPALVSQGRLCFEWLTAEYPFDAIETAFADEEAKRVYKPVVRLI